MSIQNLVYAPISVGGITDGMASPKSIVIGDEKTTETKIVEQCDMILRELDETGNPSLAITAVRNLNGVEVVAGKAKAVLIYGLSKWKKSLGDGDFYSWCVENFGGKPSTFQKHEIVGWFLKDAEGVPNEIKRKSLRELVHISRAVKAGYDLSEYWDELIASSSESDVRDVIRKSRGKGIRKGTLVLSLHPDGSIIARKDSTKCLVGWLNFQDLKGDKYSDAEKELLKSAIDSIINTIHIEVK